MISSYLYFCQTLRGLLSRLNISLAIGSVNQQCATWYLLRQWHRSFSITRGRPPQSRLDQCPAAGDTPSVAVKEVLVVAACWRGRRLEVDISSG